MTSTRIVAHAVTVCALCWLSLALTGCGGSGGPSKAELPPPIVTVAPPVERMETHYEFATGRTEALDQVDIRSRVSGYLLSIHFTPGREVKRGQLLFNIDPEPFKADRDRAKANLDTAVAQLASTEADLEKAKSQVATTKTEYDRQENAYKKGVGSEQKRDIAKGKYDQATATARSADANVKLSKAKIEEAKATLRNAEINLGYCTITSPITGIVGDKLVTEGNLITGGVASTTLLTTVVAVEKMDVAFDVDENTLQRIQQAVRDGKIIAPAPGEVPAEAGLAVHGTAYPLKGKINFADNKVDTKTGTIHMKARFDNPLPPTGARLLAAGMYARLRVPIGTPTRAMLVPESALGSDQGIAFLYIVGSDNKAVRVDAVTGLQDGDLRVIESVEVPGSGKPRPLTTSDRVIVTGGQRVRPGMTVDPKPASK